jgi:hypothetical protein
MADVDWSDPCARAAALRDAYYALQTGQSTVRVSTRSGLGAQEVWFQQADASRLLADLRTAEAECAAKTGTGAGRRFAIRGGSRRCF